MASIALHKLDTRHGVLAYADVGDGLPVLYFHGTGASSDAALLLEQSLLQSGCRLVVPQRPGYSGTIVGLRGSAKFCADLACQLLDHLNLGTVAVLGTSGGGMPAAAFAQAYPERTSALVMQCAQAHKWDAARWAPHGLGPALFLFRHRLFAPFLRWQNSRHARASCRDPLLCAKQMSGDRFAEIRDDEQVLAAMTALGPMLRSCAAAPAGVQNDWAMLVGDNGVAADSIACPTLIVHDRADPLVPFRHAEWTKTCIPQAQLLEVHAGGHLIWFGQDAAAMHEQRMAFLQETWASA